MTCSFKVGPVSPKTKLVMSQDQAKALIREAVIWWAEDDEKAKSILEEMGIKGG